MDKKKQYIKAEELCYQLNFELNSPIFTVTKILKMRKQGTIASHDMRTPGTKQPRHYFIMDEVREAILNSMSTQK